MPVFSPTARDRESTVPSLAGAFYTGYAEGGIPGGLMRDSLPRRELRQPDQGIRSISPPAHSENTAQRVSASHSESRARPRLPIPALPSGRVMPSHGISVPSCHTPLVALHMLRNLLHLGGRALKTMANFSTYAAATHKPRRAMGHGVRSCNRTFTSFWTCRILAARDVDVS